MIGKWLNAGIMENGECYYQDEGTPQGGVISPLLSNIYLHEILDKWFVNEIQPNLIGDSCIVRYADDVVLGFKSKKDAEHVLAAITERLGEYNLTLNKEKTKLIHFKRETHRSDDDRNTPNQRGFDFLGFTLYWGKTRNGNWRVIKPKTSKKSLASFLTRTTIWLKRNMHEKIHKLIKRLNSKLQGHFNYYGVTFNSNALVKVLQEIKFRLWRTLKRRTRKANLPFKKFLNRLKENFPLVTPKVRFSIIESHSKSIS